MNNPAQPTHSSTAQAKPKSNNDTLLVFEVKVYDADTNLDELAAYVLNIKMDGLTWKSQPQKMPVAFGLFKLVFSCFIQDDKVCTNALFDEIQKNEEVQSIDVSTVHKL